jgi:hypothetical protein
MDPGRIQGSRRPIWLLDERTGTVAAAGPLATLKLRADAQVQARIHCQRAAIGQIHQVGGVAEALVVASLFKRLIGVRVDHVGSSWGAPS